jgi:hypothetical protein
MKEKKEVRAAASKKGTKDNETKTLVEGLVSISKSYYAHHRKQWADNYRLWRNRNSGNMFERKKDLPVGLAWMVIDGVISAMTDGRPKPVFLPEETADRAMAEAVARIIAGPVWEELKSEETNEQVIKTALIMSGAGVTKIGVDEKGHLYDKYIDPRNCYPEPGVAEMDEMQYFITQIPTSVQKIKYAFRGLADHVTADEIADEWQSFFGGVESGYKWNANNTMNVWGNEDKDLAARLNERHGRAILQHVWMNDFSEGQIPYKPEETAEEHEKAGTYDIEPHWWENHPAHIDAHTKYIRLIQSKYNLAMLTNPMSGLPAFEKNFEVVAGEMEADVRKLTALIAHVNEHLNYPQSQIDRIYPHGREIWMCQGEVLLDRASQFGNPYKAYQFDRDLIGDFWGGALMGYMQPIQDAFNKIITKVDRHADIVANGRFFYNARSKILWDKVLTKLQEKGGRLVAQGIPVQGSPRDNIMWDYGGQMPAYVFSLLAMLERLAYSIGGYTEVMQGQIPDYASGAALGRAIQSAGVRIRKGVKHLGWYYRDKYRDYIKYLSKSDPLQIFKTIGENNEVVYHAFQNIDWDAMRDVRIDVRNVLGSYREEQFAKLDAILSKTPALAQVLLPAMLELIDVNIDMKQLDRTQEMDKALSVAHDQLTLAKAQMKK